MHLGYYAYGRDRSTERVVEPWQLFAEGGQWYLAGWCHQAGGERLFRVDRMRSARLREVTFDPPAEAAAPGVYHPAPDDPRIVLELAPRRAGCSSSTPRGGQVLPDGWTRVRLPVSAVPWLERLVVRLGPAVRVGRPLEVDRSAPARARPLHRGRGAQRLS